MADVNFGTTGSTFALDGWTLTEVTPSEVRDITTTEDHIGNVIAIEAHNLKTSYTLEYKAASSSPPTIPPSIGADINGAYVVTSIAVKTVRGDFATMTIECHSHEQRNVSTLRSAPHKITLNSGFGAQDFLGASIGANASVISGNVTISTEHVEEQDEAGDHFVSQNLEPKIEAQTEYVGVVDVAPSGWTITERKVGNTRKRGHDVSSMSGVKYLAYTT